MAEGAPIIPISAQLKYNIEVVCEYITKKVPIPKRDFLSPPRLIGKVVAAIYIKLYFNVLGYACNTVYFNLLEQGHAACACTVYMYRGICVSLKTLHIQIFAVYMYTVCLCFTLYFTVNTFRH